MCIGVAARGERLVFQPFSAPVSCEYFQQYTPTFRAARFRVPYSTREPRLKSLLTSTLGNLGQRRR
jgi:hypothetical protein